MSHIGLANWPSSLSNKILHRMQAADMLLKLMSSPKTAIIIGAGPAGLTAALELLERTNIKPIIYEASHDIGGISKTINYKGNRMDIGGHRFFSKSDRVMDWWQKILPIQGGSDQSQIDITYRHQTRSVATNPDGPDPEATDAVMLIRQRLSRIYFLQQFFEYPVTLNLTTIKQLGLGRIFKIGCSYLAIRLRPIKQEKSLEDFMVNRFGWELYHTFFKDYTEKVWGTPCNQIGADWGAQRIKGLSITKAITHALGQLVKKPQSLDQKATETSLIEQFMYPKLGPGQLWEEVAKKIIDLGGEIHLDHWISDLTLKGSDISSVTIKSAASAPQKKSADLYFSTMPVNELIAGMGAAVPVKVQKVAGGLKFRDFITVGLLVSKLQPTKSTIINQDTNLVPDNWIYIQEREVKLGRLQIFNNWSPYMVKDPDHTVWMGLEYFCNEGDELWSMTDADFKKFAAKELAQIGLIDPTDVLDATVIRIKKTYPAYFGTYDQFEEVKKYVNTINNLYLLGRNGTHKYNNADHSMLTAMTAVDNIVAGITDKDNIWAVNTEADYHEKK